MKISGTLFILVMVGSITKAAKLLKSPRIYNAFVTSDEKLLPSQAYPAIAPVVQGIQYPLPGYIPAPGLYHPFLPFPAFGGAAGTAGRSFSYAVKQDYFSYNYFENDASFAPKLPPVVPYPNQQTLFSAAAAAGLQQPQPKEQLPYPSSASRADTKQNSLAAGYQDQPEGSTGQDAGRDIYPDSSAASVPNNAYPQQQEQQQQRQQQEQQGQTWQNQDQLNEKRPYQADAYPQQNVGGEAAADSGDDSPEPATENENDGGENYLPINPLVKNNRPKDPSIVDIPPEPLPIGKSKGKKKRPEDYPPSPLNFIL